MYFQFYSICHICMLLFYFYALMYLLVDFDLLLTPQFSHLIEPQLIIIYRNSFYLLCYTFIIFYFPPFFLSLEFDYKALHFLNFRSFCRGWELWRRWCVKKWQFWSKAR